jgi:hypothetical protein
MSVHQQVKGILHDTEQSILQAIQHAESEWVAAIDEDGNPDVPDDERQVFVFLCGDRRASDDRPADAGYGIRQGWYAQDGRYWRAGGFREQYVTHWMEVPPPPALPVKAAEVTTEATELAALRRENERLLRGEFTEEEFQNLCHNMTTDDACRFKAGCEAYQKKLFGDK